MNIEDSIGGRLDLIHKHVQAMAEAQAAHYAQRERLRTIKPIFLPLVRGTASGSALTLGGDVNTAAGQSPVGPDLGFVWSLRHLVIEGLATGATPDVMNVLRNNRIIWQLNGNGFCQTFSRGDIILHSGETLQYQSVGTFNSTAQIIVHGMAEEAAAERIGVFF